MKNEITAKRLRKALANKSMKAQELAELSGVNKSSISQYINGSHAPSNISSGKIGKVLEVNPLWLMGFDVEMKKEISEKEAEKDISIIHKFSLLTKRDKHIILDMIDSMLANKESGAD
ncbi:MAG: helix-turn-helix transcriptional regulator [Lachnospiraceae bacterium]|nr:helix-turn-helix transcriptional regulator [Lachnospiraceae bacterium]